MSSSGSLIEKGERTRWFGIQHRNLALTLCQVEGERDEGLHFVVPFFGIAFRHAF
jgi:hypothetical protein